MSTIIDRNANSGDGVAGTTILDVPGKAGGGFITKDAAPVGGAAIFFRVGYTRDAMVDLHDGAGARVEVAAPASAVGAFEIPTAAMYFAYVSLHSETLGYETFTYEWCAKS